MCQFMQPEEVEYVTERLLKYNRVYVEYVLLSVYCTVRLQLG